jgi:cysteinyl-tRNA synthetase
MSALATYREDVPDDGTLDDLFAGTRADFETAMDDDLNVSAALAALFEFVHEVNRRLGARSISTSDAERISSFVRDIDRVLGVLSDEGETLEPALAALLEQRAAARAARDWAASDRLRDELAAHGISVEDTRDGQRWRRIAELQRG